MLFRGPIFFLLRSPVLDSKVVCSVPLHGYGSCLRFLMNAGYKLAGVLIVLWCVDTYMYHIHTLTCICKYVCECTKVCMCVFINVCM